MLDVSYTESANTWEDAQHHMPSTVPSSFLSFFRPFPDVSRSSRVAASLKLPCSVLALLRAKTTRLRASWAHPDPPVLCFRRRNPPLEESPLPGGGDDAMQTPTSANAETTSPMETQNAPRSSSPDDSFGCCFCTTARSDSASGVQPGLSSAHSPLHPSLAGSGPRSRRSLLLPLPISAVCSTV